jgi:hypothetical protein
MTSISLNPVTLSSRVLRVRTMIATVIMIVTAIVIEPEQRVRRTGPTMLICRDPDPETGLEEISGALLQEMLYDNMKQVRLAPLNSTCSLSISPAITALPSKRIACEGHSPRATRGQLRFR